LAKALTEQQATLIAPWQESEYNFIELPQNQIIRIILRILREIEAPHFTYHKLIHP
jgi:hypothetical protein